MVRLDRIACTAIGCNFTADISERVGTTCGYFEYCPICGAEWSLNTWTIEIQGGTVYQVYKGDVVSYE